MANSPKLLNQIPSRPQLKAKNHKLHGTSAPITSKTLKILQKSVGMFECLRTNKSFKQLNKKLLAQAI